MKTMNLMKMQTTKSLASLVLALTMAGSLLLWGCDNDGVSNGPTQQELDSLIEVVGGLNLDVDSLKNISPCKSLFPDPVAVTFTLTPSPDGTDWYDVSLAASCPADLSCVSKLCRCKCTLTHLNFSDPDLDGTDISFSMEGASTSNYTGASLRVINGKVDLSVLGSEIEYEDGLRIQVNSSTAGASCTAGGLCVVVDIEGGGN